jgi:AcrR family transcriptional regulator
MTTRERILDAAEAVVEAQGVGRLTLEAVAREAGVSKGGVLYHFAGKEELTVAMIARFTARFDGAVEGLAAEDPEPAGRTTRSYLRATLGEAPATGPSFDHACAGITAALAAFPEHLAQVRAQSARWQARIERDGLDPVLATIVRLAIDGLWLGENFNLLRLEPETRQAVTERLRAWTAEPADHLARPRKVAS